MLAHDRAGRGDDSAGREDRGSSPLDSDRHRVADPRAHFHALSREDQRDAIKRLAGGGMSAYGLAHATGLAVEQIRSIVADASDSPP